MRNAKNGSVRLRDTAMSYVSFGHGPRVLVILPGLSDGLATVRGKALLLARPYAPYFDAFTVYMFSRRDDLPPGYSIQDMAADQAEALRLLGIGKACVMGVSQGGMIAQYLAAVHPEAVEKLVLAVTAPCVSAMIRDCVTGWISLVQKGDHKALMIDTAQKSYSPARLNKYRKLYPFLGLVGKPRDYRRFLVNAEAILSFDATGLLQDITCPTLIVAGAEDRIVGAQASRDLHARIAGSGLYVYPGLGHAAYEEAKDFNRRVFSFLSE